MAGVADPVKVRILGGHHRGRVIRAPVKPGLRPTPSRVRETLFNWLQGWIDGTDVLDAYAGTGALGLEALSRGANSTLAIEKDKQLAHALGQIAEEWQLSNYTVVQGSFPTPLSQQFDLVCLDPPFGRGLTQSALANARTLLKPGGLVALEHEPRVEIPLGWSVLKSTKAGQEHLKLLEPQ